MDVADAVVIGSGPNGLVAATILARAGWSVVVLERSSVPGGAVRSEELTLPGYVHDTYSAFYGLLHASPVLQALGLDRRVSWVHLPTPVGAVVDPERAAVVRADASVTASELRAFAPADEPAWLDLVGWWRRVGTAFFDLTLRPIPSVRPSLRFLRRTGIRGALDTGRMLLEPMESFARRRFSSEVARSLVSSGITHTDLSVSEPGSVPMALILAMLSQEVGMPIPAGGAGRLAEALAACVTDAGGRIETGREVTRVAVRGGRAVAVETADGEVVSARRAVIADTGPVALWRDLVGEEHLPPAYLDGLRRFRYGTGIFKVDVALDGPVPWTSPALRECGVVHLTGDLAAMARATHEARHGQLPADPLLVVGQPTIDDPTRAPAGCHTLWIETHVPPVPQGDGAGEIAPGPWESLREPFLERVLDRIERHAPGLRARVVGVATRTPVDLERENPNLVGGDLGGGSSAIDQQLVFRPVQGWFRYRTPVKGLYMCSASTHPGGGVHGMGGRNCARRVLRDHRLRPVRLARR